MNEEKIQFRICDHSNTTDPFATYVLAKDSGVQEKNLKEWVEINGNEVITVGIKLFLQNDILGSYIIVPKYLIPVLITELQKII